MTARVLVVDDEEAIVTGLICLLEAEEIESSGASDRVSAEALMEATFYSVIVADLRLHSEAEGLELLDGIRRISPRSRVVTLTGFSTPELDKEVLRRGSVMVIRKPAGGAEIVTAIGGLLAELAMLTASQARLAGYGATLPGTDGCSVTSSATAAGFGGPELEKLHLSLRRLLHSIPRRRYGLTVDQGEEVVQQAWLLFLENREVIRMARPWLIGTVSNLCKRQIGRARLLRERFVQSDSLADLPDNRTRPPGDGMALGQALATLDEQSRALCILIAIEGYAYDEVSALMGLPLGSIGPMYIRAKSRMRARMAA